MCVIAIVDEERPTEDEITAMFETNKYGAGIAWRQEDDKTGKLMVHWRKGLDLPEIQRLMKELPLPYVAHFRIPSVGMENNKFLCHPFLIDKHATYVLAGRTNGGVLFHNGHWGEWRARTWDLLLKGNQKLPIGPWSDTRAMAFAAAVAGEGILEIINEKAVVFTPNSLQIFGDPWSTHGKTLYSNTSWIHRVGVLARARNFLGGSGKDATTKPIVKYPGETAGVNVRALFPPPVQAGGPGAVDPFALAKELIRKGEKQRPKGMISKKTWRRAQDVIGRETQAKLIEEAMEHLKEDVEPRLVH